MAFDYGSIDLGLRNPFKLEGAVTAVRGGVQTLLGVYLLFLAATSVKSDAVKGWTLMLFGAFLLATGIRALASGIYATLRYFVGRNHPTSLALNYSKSQRSSAGDERSSVAYTAQQLEEMLMGRKNMTFTEPAGILARLLHSLFRNLLFMPYPVRNLAQRLFGAWVETLTFLLAYALTAFVSLAGFAGEVGELAFPVYSILLMLYLIRVWQRTARPLNRNAERVVETGGEISLAKIITLAIFLPVVVGLGLGWLLEHTRLSVQTLEAWQSSVPSLSPGLFILGILGLALFATALDVVLLKRRLTWCHPVAEVSELRENWQESVHPNEIFINLDNLVMANRRYKEVPNRVYQELDPTLNEQVNGKGDFKGILIQEVQPRVRPMDLGPLFGKVRVAALVSGNLFLLLSAALLVVLAFDVVDLVRSAQDIDLKQVFTQFDLASSKTVLVAAVAMIKLVIWVALFRIFGQLLAHSAHLFFAEIQFESLLVYFKCEGTFTESRISTGTGIHDSTRSENTLVRSSITPWIIVSRVVSTTFADTGLRNLEHPRHILEMHKADDELMAIKQDVIAFLKDRESIASITSARDLGNASQIHQLNQQTRAIPVGQRLDRDEEAAGYLRRESGAAPGETGESESPKP